MAESASGAASEVANWGCVVDPQKQLLSRMVPRAVVANPEPVASKILSMTWQTESSSTLFVYAFVMTFQSNIKTFRGNCLTAWHLQVMLLAYILGMHVLCLRCAIKFH